MNGSIRPAITFLSFLLILASSSTVHSSNSNRKINVVTTVAPITNIVQNVGGAYTEVIGIVPDGTDSHTFEPVPTDAKILQSADIIIVNGLDLELPTVKLAEKVKKRKPRSCDWVIKRCGRRSGGMISVFPASTGIPIRICGRILHWRCVMRNSSGTN